MKKQTISNEIVVKDEEVIEALLRDAKRFKSKWELNSNETKRSRPNTTFLKRTLSRVVKINNRKSTKERVDCKNYKNQHKERLKNIENKDDLNVFKYKEESKDLNNEQQQNDECSKKRVSSSRKSKYKSHSTRKTPTNGVKY